MRPMPARVIYAMAWQHRDARADETWNTPRCVGQKNKLNRFKKKTKMNAGRDGMDPWGWDGMRPEEEACLPLFVVIRLSSV